MPSLRRSRSRNSSNVGAYGLREPKAKKARAATETIPRSTSCAGLYLLCLGCCASFSRATEWQCEPIGRRGFRIGQASRLCFIIVFDCVLCIT